MILGEQGPLCLSCHRDVERDIGQAASHHEPVSGGQCTRCHNPHKAAVDNLLLASPSDLCLSCHEPLSEKMASEKIHGPAKQECLACHQPHASLDPSLMSLPIQNLCGKCHKMESDFFVRAHIGIDPEGIECLGCHDPHASKDAMFLKPVGHSPFTERACDKCHEIERP